MYLIESQIFSRVKANFSERIKKKYENLAFTTQEVNKGDPKFPTIYINIIESSEVGSTLEGTSINGINVTFQIDVIDNESQQRADEVAAEVLRIMKSMRFKVVMMPIHVRQSGIYRTVSRYKRVISNNDIL